MHYLGIPGAQQSPLLFISGFAKDVAGAEAHNNFDKLRLFLGVPAGGEEILDCCLHVLFCFFFHVLNRKYYIGID